MILLPFLNIWGKGLVLKYRFCDNGYEGYVGGEELQNFLGIVEHINLLGDARCVTVVGEHLGGAVNNVDRV